MLFRSVGKGNDKVIVQSGSNEDTTTVATSETTESSESKSSQRGNGEEGLRKGEVAKEPKPNTPSGFHKYPNPIQEKENLVKAKALVEECQVMQVETKVPMDIKFPSTQKYPTNRVPIKVPSIIVEMNEDRMSNDEPLLMDHMFEEDPIMERLTHEVYTIFMIT